MTLTSTLKYRLVLIAAGVLFVTAVPASATIDTFSIYHYSGPCSSVPFSASHASWADRSRIVIASGERISITLYGNGADFAQDATGSDIHEWITSKGTTTDYPNAPIMFGSRVPKGYVKIAVRAAPSHGVGNRTITVKWLTGNETLRFKIVANCNAVTGAAYRPAPSSSSTGGSTASGGHQLTSTVTPIPNLMPYMFSPFVLTRPLVQEVVSTPAGGMSHVNDFFCSGLAANVVTAVPVPRITWGVIGVNIELANTQFDAQLIDVTNANNPRVLDTLNLPQGFPANTPLVQKDNYPGRLTSIRVISNPRFQIGSAMQTFMGCFTEPGSAQLLDPRALLLKVDPNNRINEGDRENDNEYRP